MLFVLVITKNGIFIEDFHRTLKKAARVVNSRLQIVNQSFQSSTTQFTTTMGYNFVVYLSLKFEL